MNNLGIGQSKQFRPYYQRYNSIFGNNKSGINSNQMRYSQNSRFGIPRQYQMNPQYHVQNTAYNYSANYNRATRLPVTSRVGPATNLSQNWHQLLRR